MSKLDKLLAKLCPNGVEYKKLGDVVEICRGVRVVKKELTDDGKYPVYQNSLKPLGGYEEANVSGGSAFVIAAGAAGEVGYSESDFWAADDCYYLKGENLVGRYAYYCLTSRQNWLVSKVRKASIPRLSRTFIEALEIPVPPLEVQEEIVRILDAFTELTAELTAELKARQQQYEHYRHELLQGHWPMTKLGEMCETVTPTMKIKRLDYQESGIVPIVSQEAEFVSGYWNFSDPKLPKGEYVCFGDHSECVKYVDFAFVQGADGLKILKAKENKILPRFFYQAAQCFYSKHNNYERHFKYFQETEIPLPPLAEQQRIVDALDRFDSLVNSISEGLPAEIEARKKQYEFYRDKLLSFKKMA